MTFPLSDQLRREELRDIRRHQLSIAGIAAVAVILIGMGFLGGVYFSSDHAPKEPSPTVQAIENLTDSLQVVNARADSIHRIDSTAMVAVLAQRPKTRGAMAPIRVTDSTVIVERPAANSQFATDSSRISSSVVADTFASPVLAEGIRQMQLQLFVDSIALDSARFALRTEVAGHQRALTEQRDSLQTQHAKELERETSAAWRRGVRTGVKVVLGTAVTIAGVVKIVKIIPK